MSFPGDQDPEPELTTTRIGGGIRAWLIALGAVLLLGSVVYVGLSGKSPSVGASSGATSGPGSSSGHVTIAEPAPAALPPEVTAVRADPTAPVLYQYLGTALTLGNRGTLAILDQVAPGEYRGSYRIPYGLVQSSAHLEFDAVTASTSHDESNVLGQWTVPLIELAAGAPSTVVLDESVGPQSQGVSDPDFQDLATNGFHLTVTTQGVPDAATMTIDVQVGPRQTPPAETYGLHAGKPNMEFSVPLTAGTDGQFEGQTEMVKTMFGRQIEVDLDALVSSGPTAWQVDVGSWNLKVPARPRSGNLNVLVVHQNGDPQPTGSVILANGFDLRASEVLEQGQLYLSVVLTVGTPSPGPVHTD